MRTRTFIGLIILVVALMVASIPALLTPTADGVEHLAVQAGVLEDPAAAAEAERKAEAKRDKASRDATDVESTLEIKGFTVEEDGDLRDTRFVGARDVNERGRLAAGNARVLLPGQRPGTDAYSPPFASEDGVLLDIDGCPVFRPEADVAAMMADEATNQRYADKVASADDPAACRTVFEERIALATDESQDGGTTSASRRQLAGLEYKSLESLGITMREYEMLTDIFDFENPPTVSDPTASESTTAGDSTAGTKQGTTTATTSTTVTTK